MMQKEKLKIYIYLLGVIAFLFIIFILSFYIHTAILVGHLPTYANPDPATISIYSFYAPLIYFVLVLWMISFFVWLVISGVYMYEMKESVQIKPLFISFIGHLLAWIVFSSEILNWFLD